MKLPAVLLTCFPTPAVLVSEVRVSFKGKTAKANADANGKWRVPIESGPAGAHGATLTISAGPEKREIKDVLVAPKKQSRR